MRLGAIAFLLGILALQALPELPARYWTLTLPGVLLVLGLVPRLRWLAWAMTGFLWALLLASPPAVLPVELEGVEITLDGWIATIPEDENRSVRFEFKIAAAQEQTAFISPLVGRRVRLTWWDEPQADPDEEENTEPVHPALRVGDRWRFTVRLKKPWGLLNPGGFDYERWLYAQGIVATGSIRAHPPPQRLATAERYPLDRYRQYIADQFNEQLPNNPYVGILIALAVGAESGITSWQWEIFNRTGVGHLMSISGSHIGLITGLMFVLAWGIWSRVPLLPLYWPATRAAGLVALASAGIYTLLSGLSVPAQRAFIMAAVALFAVTMLRPAIPSRILALALLVVLVIDPIAPLQVGFWLSFSAVAAILYSVSGRSQEQRRFGKTVHLQLDITLALLPLTLLFFQQFPLLSPLANLIAIPWVGCTVLPFSLLAALLIPFSDFLSSIALHLAALTMEGLWHILRGLDQWSALTMLHRPTPPLWTMAFALFGVALWLAPRGLPMRWLGIPLCLPLLWPPMVTPSVGGFWFTLLDVGEGLAAVIQTRHHVLVYDTGRRLGMTLDTGRAALVPFLRHQGREQVDVLMVSHADSQHTGGVRSLRELLPVGRMLTSAPDETPITGVEPCQAGASWEWEGVRFQILHPPSVGFRGDDASCVLKVTGLGGRVLLPGDIETSAEAALTNRYGQELAAEVLVAPHQGRRNLSTPTFLNAVQPRYILFATGYHNRYGYPRPDTVARYQATGATLLNSSEEGALTFRLEPGQPLELERYRQEYRRYWTSP